MCNLGSSFPFVYNQLVTFAKDSVDFKSQFIWWDDLSMRAFLFCLQRSPEMFFRDGKRRIDFVIAYRKGQDDEMKEAKRFAFLNALADQMIEIEVRIIFLSTFTCLSA